jgi:hypothetical protein
MKIVISPTGITESIAPGDIDPSLEPHGRVFYVYVHRDKTGNVFYVGKGQGHRAWSLERHPIWHHYVQTRLHGEYDVEIVRSNLLNSEAEELEGELVNQYGEHLVNWFNTGRQFDYEALERFHALRDPNKQFVAETRPLEKTDPHQAVERYQQAMRRMYEYESIVRERGLVAQLMSELGGPAGDNTILDRLTLCLCKLGRTDEAMAIANKYYAHFPARRTQAAAGTVLRRIERAQRKVASH